MVKEALTGIYENIVLSLPDNLRIIPPLISFSILIALYALFVWVFYRSLAKRDLLKLNLKKYNKFEMAGIIKLFAVFFYIIEYVIIIPIVITLWFAGLSILLVILAKEQPVNTVLLISAAIIGATRITAYFKEDLSKDLAKMFPFTLLGVVILTPGFFDFSTTVARFSEIPSLFTNIISFAVFIIVFELVLRSFYLVYSLFTSGEDEGDEGAEIGEEIK